MTGMILLIDYENVQKVDLSHLPPDADVKFFVGARQPKVTMTLGQAQMAGRMAWIQIDGQGKDALDFHIAYYLGRFVLEYPKARHVILSKDKGFDPLVRHLKGQGYQCERIAQLTSVPKAAEPRIEKITAAPKVKKSAPVPKAEKTIPAIKAGKSAPPKAKKPAPTPKAERPAASPEENLKRVIDLLRKIEKIRRPHTRAKLTKWIAAAFQNKLSQPEVDRVLKQLAASGLVTEANKELSYKL